MKKKVKKEITSRDLAVLLAGLRIKLDCGHWATPGHNFSNTLIILSLGGEKIETKCHDCGY
jgi:hypothetical protein